MTRRGLSNDQRVYTVIKIGEADTIQEIDFTVHAAYELLDLIKIMLRQVVDKWFCRTLLGHKKINMSHCKSSPRVNKMHCDTHTRGKFMTPTRRFNLLIFISLLFVIVIINTTLSAVVNNNVRFFSFCTWIVSCWMLHPFSRSERKRFFALFI